MAEPGCPPDVLTIEEAARVLRMGRAAAYEQARIWRDTKGRAGLPNVRGAPGPMVDLAAIHPWHSGTHIFGDRLPTELRDPQQFRRDRRGS
jgi:hypothetical protein